MPPLSRGVPCRDESCRVVSSRLMRNEEVKRTLLRMLQCFPKLLPLPPLPRWSFRRQSNLPLFELHLSLPVLVLCTYGGAGLRNRRLHLRYLLGCADDQIFGERHRDCSLDSLNVFLLVTWIVLFLFFPMDARGTALGTSTCIE